MVTQLMGARLWVGVEPTQSAGVLPTQDMWPHPPAAPYAARFPIPLQRHHYSATVPPHFAIVAAAAANSGFDPAEVGPQLQT